ncbi:MAG: hypothetical protein QN122_13505 [Armatimonadota bacterium]|nr:hypothetical protein [Armatimonadota bacterium]
MDDGPIVALQIREDRAVLPRGVVYHGGILRAAAAGAAEVELHHGTGTSADLLDIYRAPADDHDMHIIERGIAAPQGIFVNLLANVEVFVLFYRLPTSHGESPPVILERGY